MHAAPKLTVVDTPAGELDGIAPILLPKGDYQLGLQHWSTYKAFGRQPKLVLWFKVLDMGQHFEAMVPRYFNVKRLIGKPGRSGRFAAAYSSDFVRDYARVMGSRQRLDRFDLNGLRSLVVVGHVDTVTRGHDQGDLADGLRYSVVRRLLRPL